LLLSLRYPLACLSRSLPPSPPFSLFFSRPPPHRALHSFPTRRSSDLILSRGSGADRAPPPDELSQDGSRGAHGGDHQQHGFAARSEEHTSELQSRFDLVCRLLLEKKKNNNRELKEQEDSTGLASLADG